MNTELTTSVLADILRTSAGEDDGFQLDDTNLDASFDDLGYDSLALLQVTGVLQQKYGLSVSDEQFQEADTPRKLITLAHQHINVNS